MPRPLVIAYHLVWTVYGSWLPNDPRGSMSTEVRNSLLDDLGTLHHGRKRVQPASREIRNFYESANPRLAFPSRPFSPAEIDEVAGAFSKVIESCRYTCYACALMPDHVHVLIRKHRDLAEAMIQDLQRESHIALRSAGFFDLDHPVWGGCGWKVFLDSPQDIRRIIQYINSNPGKAGRPAQNWSFVREYDGWPLHRGHSLDSPYARRLQRE
ncbi:MAG TPA: hypothetical protein VIM11_21940 [Tepidisphaeraceae bacterium]|jgi:REP element-mobilizing transposase RayT